MTSSVRMARPKGTRATASSQIVTSTGIASLDELLGGGIQMGSLLLLKEDRFTSYSTLVLNYVAAQAIDVENTLSVVSLDKTWDPAELMAKVKTKENKNTELIPNPAAIQASRQLGGLRDDDKMKIAWRYQNLPKIASLTLAGSSTFSTQFDLTKEISAKTLQTAKIMVYSKSNLDCNSVYSDLLSKITETLKFLPVE
jgi:elongator complex protein 4